MQRNTMKTFKEQKMPSTRGECSVKEWDLLAWGQGRSTFCCRNSTANPKSASWALWFRAAPLLFNLFFFFFFSPNGEQAVS